MGYVSLASIFEAFSTFKFKCWCQICARELGKFYITEGSQEVCGIPKKVLEYYGLDVMNNNLYSLNIHPKYPKYPKYPK